MERIRRATQENVPPGTQRWEFAWGTVFGSLDAGGRAFFDVPLGWHKAAPAGNVWKAYAAVLGGTERTWFNIDSACEDYAEAREIDKRAREDFYALYEKATVEFEGIGEVKVLRPKTGIPPNPGEGKEPPGYVSDFLKKINWAVL